MLAVSPPPAPHPESLGMMHWIQSCRQGKRGPSTLAGPRASGDHTAESFALLALLEGSQTVASGPVTWPPRTRLFGGGPGVSLPAK